MAWLGYAVMALEGAAAVKTIISKPPGVGPQKPPPLLPDTDALQQSKRREAALRFGQLGTGKASTVLSQPGGQPLGG